MRNVQLDTTCFFEKTVFLIFALRPLDVWKLSFIAVEPDYVQLLQGLLNLVDLGLIHGFKLPMLILWQVLKNF